MAAVARTTQQTKRGEKWKAPDDLPKIQTVTDEFPFENFVFFSLFHLRPWG